jgi:ribosomal protein S18 acetylase RimI-like enzyme
MLGAAAEVSVRPAGAADPPAIAAVQERAWRAAYADVLPERTLAALRPDALVPVWERAVREPPTRRHAVLVALTGSMVVGFAAVEPNPDPDAADDEAQLAVLAVDPAHLRAGHGSRLLSAVVAHLRDVGLTSLTAWTPERDLPRVRFLASAGMLPDGARRTYARPGGGSVVEVRYAADIGEPLT